MSEMEVVLCHISMVMPYLHPLYIVNNEHYEEGNISQVFVFVYVFLFNFALNLFPLEVCWAWSTIASKSFLSSVIFHLKQARHC